MSENESVRKVQRLGGSSLIITLPKQWAKRLGIKVGDEVLVIDEGGRLTLVPKDPMAEVRTSTVSVRYGSVLRSVGLNVLVDCAIMHGYNRLEIQLKGLSQADVSRITEELRSNPKVASVEVSAESVVATFVPVADADAARLIKEESGTLQELLDAAKAGDLDKVEALRALAVEQAQAAVRASRRSAVDPMALGALVSLPDAVADVALVLRSRPDVLDMVKEMVSEFMGGLASLSARRLSHAAAIAAELRRAAMQGGREQAALVVLADVVRSVALTVVCPAIVSGSPEAGE